MIVSGWAVLVMVLSYCIARWVRFNASVLKLVDIPNNRSSHALPTPRGGGISFFLIFLLLVPVCCLHGLLTLDQAIGYLGAGGLAGVVGFADDRGHVPAKWRMLSHLVAAGWAVYWGFHIPVVDILGLTVEATWLAGIVTTLYLAWMLNLYNFMDGIDGLASAEAICICLGAAAIYMGSGHPELAVMPVMLTAAVMGFAVLNFPPAKIFMGDVGSGFLGLVIGLFSLQAAAVNTLYFFCWLILAGVFIVDSGWTLVARVLRGKRVYEAHRSHCYQIASRQFRSHKVVTVAYAGITIFWLFPLALWVGVGGANGAAVLALAYTPLFVGAYWFGAGDETK
ncbi:MraY family glycosyltransferase [Pseudomonas sp. RIT-To-2]|uniref:MraY family glycosyltransferase n=1 Tax=Pseudomonas sp. RIT-To-2 TaxID=3462541 RepID=UPI0024133737